MTTFKKTLYIQIDNNPLPEGCGDDVVVLDCRCINDFCSIVGDALVSDLKDEDGKPLYRVISPVGRLLSDFEKVDVIHYNLIIAQWLDILVEMLHEGVKQRDRPFDICFPPQYTDWLICNENEHYVEIGMFLQSNDGKCYLDSKDISEEIILTLHMRIVGFINNNKEKIGCAVFSNNIITSFSNIIIDVNRSCKFVMFMSFNQWQEKLESKSLRRKYLEQGDPKAFQVDSFVLGETRLDNLQGKYKIINNELDYRGGKLKFRKNILEEIYFESKNDESVKVVNELISFIVEKNIDCKEISYNELFPLLEKKGFILSDSNWDIHNPHTSFWRILRKEMPHHYSYRIVFHANLDEIIDMEHNDILLRTHLDCKGTLRRITLIDWSLL